MIKDLQSLTNEECEEMILAYIIYTGYVSDDLKCILHIEHFSNYFFGEIYKACLKFSDLEMKLDAMVLLNHFANDEKGDEFKKIIIDITTTKIVNLTNPIEYALIISELFKRRELYKHSNVFSKKILDLKTLGNLKDVVLDSQKEVLAILKDIELKESVSFTDLMNEKLQTIKDNMSNPSQDNEITTDLKPFDNMIGALSPSDLIIIAGRPSMGKTAFVTNIATTISEKKKDNLASKGVVLFFSLEMSCQQIVSRVLGSYANIDSNSLKNNRLSQKEMDEMAKAREILEHIPFYVDDSATLTIDSIIAKAKRYHEMHKVDLIVVDYLQLIRGNSKNAENRTLEISEICRGLKQLAKELNVPVIALSQLSRAVETRECKRPILSDLRDSGSIEQDADIVVFIFREEYYLNRSEPQQSDYKKHMEWADRMRGCKNVAELIVAKNRHGKIGTALVKFDESKTKFY